MKIRKLHISNFRAIKNLILENLGQTVVVAGPNGSGKSCIFDSIRLLKSVYGGYQQDEIAQWFNEFQIRQHRLREDLPRLFQNKSKELLIEAVFELSQREVAFLQAEARKILEHELLKRKFPNLRHTHYRQRPIDPEILAAEKQINSEVEKLCEAFYAELSKQEFYACLRASPTGDVEVADSLVLNIVFSLIEPEHLGVVDFHGANRNYSREAIGGINLNLENEKRNYRNHMLYNYANKYSNVKQEMAGEFVRDLLTKQADPDKGEEENESLTSTLKELFSVFFPGKEFLGPVANPEGTLDFPVRMSDGIAHDINDLSSGEKEVLYGYLRLRNSSPRDSIILLDEPELHLNPRLISGLPRFYHKHLGIARNNQMWLVTHSDEFLRNAVGEPGFSVFHMQPLNSIKSDNQAVEIEASDQLENALLALVGDLATYGPNKNVVIFEGDNSEFDLTMTKRLFPEFLDVVNAVSAGGKSSVQKLHELMSKAAEAGDLKVKFFSVTDLDGKTYSESQTASFTWDSYHIENYLLEPKYIAKALDDLTLGKVSLEAEDIRLLLIRCANIRMDSLIRHAIMEKVNDLMVNTLSLGVDPKCQNLAVELNQAVQRSSSKINEMLFEGELQIDTLSEDVNSVRQQYEGAICDGTWVKKFKGRDILKELCNQISVGLSYEVLRNSILACMVSDGFEPPGMKKVIDEIQNQCM